MRLSRFLLLSRKLKWRGRPTRIKTRNEPQPPRAPRRPLSSTRCSQSTENYKEERHRKEEDGLGSGKGDIEGMRCR